MIKYSFHAFENIELEDGFVEEQTPYGPAVAIEDQAGLELAIVQTFVFKNDGLSGGQLKAIRRALALTQEELATHLGIDRQTIIRWETDKNTPSRAEDYYVRSLAAQRWYSRNAIGCPSMKGGVIFPKTLIFKWSGSQWISRNFTIANAKASVMSPVSGYPVHEPYATDWTRTSKPTPQNLGEATYVVDSLATPRSLFLKIRFMDTKRVLVTNQGIADSSIVLGDGGIATLYESFEGVEQLPAPQTIQ